MHRSHNYNRQQSANSKGPSSHGTSSAFSPNANPNEDWTKISDLAERRRIQNRIAQRNYRKKLKRRLEDLERRAASTSASPEQSHREPELPSKASQSAKSRARHRSAKSSSSSPSASGNTSSKSSPSHNSYSTLDERGAMFLNQCTKQLSASPPPAFSYPSYSQFDSYEQPIYGQPPIYNSIQSIYTDLSYQGEYVEPLPSILPAAGPYTSPNKRAQMYTDEDIISPFSMSYATMAGIDLCGSSQAQLDSNIGIMSQPQTYQSSLSSPSLSPEASILTFPLTPESSDPCSPLAFSFI